MLIKFPLFNQSGVAITGAAVTVKIMRDADDFLWDFDDSTFKVSGWVDETGDMTEPDSTNMAGLYELAVVITAFDDGTYTILVNYAGTPAQAGTDEFQVEDGELAHDALITDIKFLRQYEEGRWKIDTTTNQLTIYAADGTTALITYNLKDADGVATSDTPYERVEAS